MEDGAFSNNGKKIGLTLYFLYFALFDPLFSTRLRLSLDRAGDAQIVIVRGKRWGHAGLIVEGRRGQGDWEEIGILGRRALRDTRPLAVRGQPEVREYRARFFDGSDHLSGDWSPVETVTVSP